MAGDPEKKETQASRGRTETGHQVRGQVSSVLWKSREGRCVLRPGLGVVAVGVDSSPVASFLPSSCPRSLHSVSLCVPVCQPQRGRPGWLLVWTRLCWAPGEAGPCWGGDCRGRTAESEPGGPASSGRRLWGTRTPFVPPGPACPWPQTARCQFTQRRSPWSSSSRGLELGEMAQWRLPEGGEEPSLRGLAWVGRAGSAGPSPPCGCPGCLPGPAAP